MKLSGIKYLADQGVENIWKNKMMAFATFCVLLISLLLVGIASLFYINMNRMIIGLGDKNEISVFMDVGASDEDVKKAEEAIRAISNVNTIEFKSKEDALESQKKDLPKAKKLIENYITDAEFMPDGFSVTVKDNDTIADTTAEIQKIAKVQKAYSSPQVAEFLKELRIEEISTKISQEKSEERKHNVEVDLYIDAFIPQDYIEDEDIRILFYRKISNIYVQEEIDEIRNELLDRFGKIPENVENLFKIAQIKINASKIFVERISEDKRFCYIYFRKDTNFDKIDSMRFITDYNSLVEFNRTDSFSFKLVKSKIYSNFIDYIIQFLKEFKKYMK